MDYDDFEDEEENNNEEKDDMMDEDPPKFSLMNLEHEMDADIVCCDIQNDVVAIVGKSGRIIARNDDGLISHSVASPHKLFLDPTGQHLFVSSLSGDLFYCPVMPKSKPTKINLQQQAQAVPQLADLVKFDAHVIESIAWNTKNKSAGTTTRILLGTRQGGLIFEACVDVSGTTGAFTTLKLVYELPVEELPIVGLEADYVGQQLLVVATSLHRIYRFEYNTFDTHPTPFGELFDQYADTPPQLNEMPLSGDSVAKGSLFVLRTGMDVLPQAYAWACSVGIIHGLYNSKALIKRAEKGGGDDDDDFDLDAMDHDIWDDDDGETYSNEQTIQFNSRMHAAGTLDKAPLDIALTQFHMYLLYEDRLQVLNVIPGMRWVGLKGTELTENDFIDRVRFEPFKFRRVRNLKGIIRDVGAKRTYVYNNISIWEVEVEDESNTQWRRFLERGLDKDLEEESMRTRYLQAALALARADPQRRDVVAYNLGCHYLQARNFPKATDTFAECNRFENIVCKLQDTGKSVLVFNYLLARFRFLVKYRKKSTHVSQIACLIAFVAQLKLENITSFHGNEQKQLAASDELTEFLQEAYKAEPSIFDGHFYDVIARMLQAHGRMRVMLKFAESMNHVHYTVHFHVSMENFDDACTVLCTKCRRDPKLASVWYEFAPAIICHCPVALITGMLKATQRNEDSGKATPLLNTEKLIPAFLNYKTENNEDGSDENEVMLYLSSMITRYDEQTPIVHDFYLSLLVEQMDPTELEDFLESSEFYNKEYALRLCLDRKKLSQCVYLYKELAHCEEAVEVALYTNALDKAKDIATEVSENEILDYATLKKLWMLIVEHVIKKYGTGQALQIIDESNGILKMEDVLGQFSDDTVIRDFKDAVCKALDEYAAEIRQLKDGMNDATDTARMIKEDTQALRHRFGFITTTQRCELCDKPLLASANPFLVYPSCRHVFHEHCVVQHLAKVGGIGAFRTSGVNGAYLEDAQVSSLEDLASVECVLCGECAVLEIAQPFYTDIDPTWDILF